MTSELLSFDGANLTSKWKTREIKNAMNNSVIAGDVVYGVDGKQGSRNSRLVAVSLSSGELIWSKEDFGFGNTIGVGEHILSLSEAGELAVTGMNKSFIQRIFQAEDSGLHMLDHSGFCQSENLCS
jgi:outer membrane protein assembly factor BamB